MNFALGLVPSLLKITYISWARQASCACGGLYVVRLCRQIEIIFIHEWNAVCDPLTELIKIRDNFSF